MPNKLEWQFAAKGGLLSSGYSYAGSNKLEEVAWFGQNTNGCTHIIGEKEPNELSIYDMSGNAVWIIIHIYLMILLIQKHPWGKLFAAVVGLVHLSPADGTTIPIKGQLNEVK